MFEIEVAYAVPERQAIILVKVQEGCTAKEAILASNILQQFPEIDLSYVKIGIFSQPIDLERTLRAGDRIEIYRPLLIDPMQARRQRAKKPK